MQRSEALGGGSRPQNYPSGLAGRLSGCDEAPSSLLLEQNGTNVLSETILRIEIGDEEIQHSIRERAQIKREYFRDFFAVEHDRYF
jgi:hypothetical protein